MMRKGEALYYADNSQLRSEAPGIAYRLSPNMEDKDIELLPWRNCVRACELGGGWVQLLDGRFLPTAVGGIPVLVSLDKTEHCDARSQARDVAQRGRSTGQSVNLPGLKQELGDLSAQLEEHVSSGSATRPSHFRVLAGALASKLENVAAELEQLVLAARTERCLERDARSPSVTKRSVARRRQEAVGDDGSTDPETRSGSVSPVSQIVSRVQTDRPSEDGEQESDRLEHLRVDDEEAAELGGGAFPGVKLVSLGCYCGPKLTFQRMGRGALTLPFDWIRTRFEGILHFLRTDFEGFFDFRTKQQVPGCRMTMYRGPHHSFWHDDPTDPSMHERYERRIQRFRELGALSQPLLFVRVAADALFELVHAPDLAGELVAHYGAAAKLLLILNFQDVEAVRHFLLDGCNAMVSCLPAGVHSKKDPAFRAPFAAPVRAGLAWAAGSCSPIGPEDPGGQIPVLTLDEACQLVRPDTSGFMGLGGLKSFEEL